MDTKSGISEKTILSPSQAEGKLAKSTDSANSELRNKGSEPSITLETLGFTLPARYSFVRLLGQGGMGAVIEALDESLKRPCAIKIIKKNLLNEENLLKRFQTEAEITATINHPNIIQIFDIGEVDGNPFFVMEKFSTLTLRSYVSKYQPKSEKLLPLFKQIIRGLKAAKGKNLLHRDIKPDNILVNREGHSKIIDFGLCRPQNGGEINSLTQTGTILGSPHYMSPEQCHGKKDIDYKSDVYSAGATFFYCLTGNVPFGGESFVQVMMQHCQEKRPSAHEINHLIPVDLSQLVIDMMAIKPEERPEYEAILRRLEKLEEGIVLNKNATPLSISLPPVGNSINHPNAGDIEKLSKLLFFFALYFFLWVFVGNIITLIGLFLCAGVAYVGFQVRQATVGFRKKAIIASLLFLFLGSKGPLFIIRLPFCVYAVYLAMKKTTREIFKET